MERQVWQQDEFFQGNKGVFPHFRKLLNGQKWELQRKVIPLGGKQFFFTIRPAAKEVFMEGLDPRLKLFLIAFGAFLLLLLILIISHDYRRRKGLAALAKDLGFTYEREATQLLEQFEHFRLFPVGRNQRITNVFRGETGSATVWLLDYSCVMGRHMRQEYSVCVLRSPDLKLPYFYLTCEIHIPGADRLETFLASKGIFLGSRDIDFPEDEKFSKRFFLKGEEEAKIRLLFDLDLRQYLLRFARTLVRIEGNRDTLLFTTGEPVLPKAAREVIQQGTDLFTLFSQRTASWEKWTEGHAFTHVVNSLKEDLPGTKAKDRIPMKDLPQGTGAEKKGRGSSIALKGIIFLIGAILAVVGGVIIYTEIQGTLAGRTDPLSRRFLIGLLFLIAGLGIALEITVFPLMFLKYLRNDQRGVVFRLGSLIGVVGPGLVITLPGLDRVVVVDLGEAFPGWEGYGKEELKQKIISLVLDSPDGGERYGVKS